MNTAAESAIIRGMENKKITLAVLAHVDAGKTTLSEAMLYTAGSIRALGRVDHKSSFLDTGDIERDRGITVFSKTAPLTFGGLRLCLLDTPGHVDFSPEAERCLAIADYAVIVISASDGVQAHTETLWRLLERRGIPCFIFVTKTDLPTADTAAVTKALRKLCGDGCIDFTGVPDAEEIAMCDEAVLDRFMESGTVSGGDIAALIKQRKLFPAVFGSGLKLIGIERFLELLEQYTLPAEYGDAFGARVCKILRDGKGNRLTLLKVTGGELSCRDMIKYTAANGSELEEKITEIRIYSGAKFDTVETAKCGTVCAVRGLTESFGGQGLGFEKNADAPSLSPVMEYSVTLPEGVDPTEAMKKLRILEDEEPSLHLVWKPLIKRIGIRLMGKVQTEVITQTAKDRFGLDIALDKGSVMYRETVENTVVGIGHFEPLRHYAEAHLELSPLPNGSGLEFCDRTPEDTLDPVYRRLILALLREKEHVGVLTGSPITDMRISLIAGKAHIKHTEGGDFREAAYRALRQGLMKARSVLLEPWYEFKLTVPSECIGRAINDLRAMSAVFDTESDEDLTSVLIGRAPVTELSDYASELASYTSGRGRLELKNAGYFECHNADEVIARIAYEPTADLDNTPDSVFCSHGAGRTIPWNEVDALAHIDTGYGRDKTAQAPPRFRSFSIDDRELEAIMEREFGPIRRREYGSVTAAKADDSVPYAKASEKLLIIDGYNLIFGWDKLKSLAETDLGLARERLCDRLKSYAAFRDCEPIVVFDGYKVSGNEGEKEQSGRLRLVYTKENETADMYIEKLANDIGKNLSVRVVTNDSLIRLSALRSGVLRMSVAEFVNELEFFEEQMKEYTNGKNGA